MTVAMVLLVADCGVVMAMTAHPAIAAVTSAARIAALCALWSALKRRAAPGEHRPSQWWPTAAYAYALVVVFGSAAVAGARNWIWLPTCDGRLVQSLFVQQMVVVDRGFAAAIGAVIVWACCRAAPPPARPAPARVPGVWSIATLATFSFPLCFIAAEVYIHLVGAQHWCHQLTADALPPAIQFWTFVASGFEEELTFTGAALVLLLGARKPQLFAVLAVNIAARMSLHLYYADHRTVLLWLGWIVIWSGGGLMVAMAVGRYAMAHGLSRPRFAVIWAVSTACAHSLSNMFGMGGRLVLLLATLLVMAVCAVEMAWRGPRARNMFWWLTPPTGSPGTPDPEREPIGDAAAAAPEYRE